MQPVTDFSGGWCQKPRHQLAPNELIDAVNVVPNGPGDITTRLGEFLIGGTTESDSHSLHVAYDEFGTRIRYQGAGRSLYRNFIQILSGLSGVRLFMATLRGFGEQKSYTFFAGGAQDALRVKDDGGTLTRWGLSPPSFFPVAGAPGGAGGLLAGKYGWLQTFVRKPSVPAGYGRWTQATGSRTSTAVPFNLTTSTNNDGYYVAGARPFGEIVLTLTTAASAATYLYSYWAGSGYVSFVPDILPVYTATGITRVGFSFPASAWVPVNGEYIILVQATTAATTSAVASRIVLYDGVVAARSNPSAHIIAPTTVTLGQTVGLTLADPTNVGVNADGQVTHVELYRTRGDDPAFVNPGVITGDPVYFYEADVPAGVTTYTSTISDDALQELLELDNERPLAFTTIAEHQNRLFGAVGNRLYFSKPFMPESFGPYVEVSTLGDPLLRIEQYDGILYLWTGARVYMLMGTDETSYDPRQIQSPTGLGAAASVARGERGIYFLGADGNLWRLQGSSTAVNISHDAHYPFFHDEVCNGVLPLWQAHRDSCAAAWANNRYYLSYPTEPVTTPFATLFLDETTETWWRDTRAFRALHYDRQGNSLEGANLGQTVELDVGDTDFGAAIPWTIQTRDDDSGTPTSATTLTQLTVEADTGGLPLTVLIVRDYGTLPDVAYGTCTTAGRLQVPLIPTTGALPQAKAFGYRLTGSGPMTIYRLLPQALGFPAVRKAWETLPTTLGYEGTKRLEQLFLDVDVLAGVLTCQLFLDSAQVLQFTVATLGRTLTQHLTEPLEGDIVQLLLTCTGTFLLYPGSLVAWRALPPAIQTDTLLPTELGYPGQKLGMAYRLDIDLLEPGTVTTTFLADGVAQHTLRHTSVGRVRSPRHRLPAALQGRLLEIRRTSTAPYRLWGSALEWVGVGVPGVQQWRSSDGTYGPLTKAPLDALAPTATGG